MNKNVRKSVIAGSAAVSMTAVGARTLAATGGSVQGLMFLAMPVVVTAANAVLIGAAAQHVLKRITA